MEEKLIAWVQDKINRSFGKEISSARIQEKAR